MEAVALGRDYALENFDCPLPIRAAPRGRRQGQDPGVRQRRRRARRHLRRRHRVRLVSDHALDLAGRGVRAIRQAPARHQGRAAAVRHRAGGGRAGRHRRRHRRRLERRALLHGHLRPRHLADERVPGARLLRRGAGGAVQHPARRPLDRHADAHAAVRHHLLRLRLARRHQARAAVPGQSDRMLLDGRAGFRPRRAAADARHRHVRSRHRHERLGDGAVRLGRRARARPRQGAGRRAAGEVQGASRARTGAAIRTSTATPSPTARCPARTRPRAPSSRAAPRTTRTRATPRTGASTRACSTASAASSTRPQTLVPKPEVTIRDKSGKTGLIYFGANDAGRARGARPARARGRQGQRAAHQGLSVHARRGVVLRHARARVRRRAEPRRADALPADDRGQRARRQADRRRSTTTACR